MEITGHMSVAIGVVQERKTAVNTCAGTTTVVLGRLGIGHPNSVSEQRISAILFGSTIEAIDQTGLNITVQTAGRREKRSMPVMNSAVVKGIRGGDRVSLGLDQEGRVVNLRKLPPILTEASEPRG